MSSRVLESRNVGGEIDNNKEWGRQGRGFDQGPASLSHFAYFLLFLRRVFHAIFSTMPAPEPLSTALSAATLGTSKPGQYSGARYDEQCIQLSVVCSTAPRLVFLLAETLPLYIIGGLDSPGPGPRILATRELTGQ